MAKNVEIALKNTGIRITCQTAEEASQIYNDMGHRSGFVIDGEELKSKGPIDDHSYFAGYTRDYFKKYFGASDKLQALAEEKGLVTQHDDEIDLEV